jgi:hypothetical protein
LLLFFRKEGLSFVARQLPTHKYLLTSAPMSTRAQNWCVRAGGLGRVVALVLALAAHLTSGALAAPDRPADTPSGRLAAVMVLCVGGNHHGSDGQAPIHHHLPGPAIASVLHHFSQHAAIVDEFSSVAPAGGILAVWTGLPEARGPPVRDAAGFYPTGPPSHLI